MKRIITLLALAAILTVSIFVLSACSGSSDTPDGMQLIAGGEDLGYYFYAPEEWTPSSIGEIKAAYISRVDPTSVSFAEIKNFSNMPEGVDKNDYFFNQYFKDSLAEFPTPPKVANENGEKIIFGKISESADDPDESADEAKKYAYTYEYYDYNANDEFTFGVMQILIREGDRYYIFTYSASMEERASGMSHYEYYLGDEEDEGKVMELMSEFRFVPIVKSEEESKEYEVDEDGFTLVSDEDLSGFSLYVPPMFSEDFSSAIVSATHTDGSNITFTEANGANENVNTYMLRRFGQLKEICTDLTYETMVDENGEDVLDPNGKKVIKYTAIDFGNADAANAYEYSFTYNGSKYRVYQVIVVEGWKLSYDGYVFTFTAKEENYKTHIDNIMKTIEKVDFK